MPERKPKRIQRKRERGWRMPEGARYVGRPTKWGNPYVVGRVYWGGVVQDKGHAMDLFWEDIDLAEDGMLPSHRIDFWRNNHPLESLGPFYIVAQAPRQLAGKDLVCWCRPEEACHADYLLEIANA